MLLTLHTGNAVTKIWQNEILSRSCGESSKPYTIRNLWVNAIMRYGTVYTRCISSSKCRSIHLSNYMYRPPAFCTTAATSWICKSVHAWHMLNDFQQSKNLFAYGYNFFIARGKIFNACALLDRHLTANVKSLAVLQYAYRLQWFLVGRGTGHIRRNWHVYLKYIFSKFTSYYMQWLKWLFCDTFHVYRFLTVCILAALCAKDDDDS